MEETMEGIDQYAPLAERHQRGRVLQLQDGGHLVYVPEFFPGKEADGEFAGLLAETRWEDHGRPRRTAWVGDFAYSYSGIHHPATPWSERLARLRTRVEAAVFGESRGQYQGVLLNFYENGEHGVGFHADNENTILRDSPIASISLGAEREFVLKYEGKARPIHKRVTLPLGHGSLLIMGGTIQRHWRHSIPQTDTPVGPRINLTFRQYQV